MKKQVIHELELEKLQQLAELMDNRFVIPGTSIRLGLDSILGLLPGIGDTATVLVTLYLAGKAKDYDLPGHVRGQIYWNAFIDWLIGLVPFFGDIFDIGWKANVKNVALIRKHLEKSREP
jgi:hypothetical protein